MWVMVFPPSNRSQTDGQYRYISLPAALTADDVDGLLFFDDRGGRLLLRGNKMFLKELRMGTQYYMNLCIQKFGLRTFCVKLQPEAIRTEEI